MDGIRVVAEIAAGIGRPIAMADAQIAATAIAHGGVLATGNTSDFTGLDLETVDPCTHQISGA